MRETCLSPAKWSQLLLLWTIISALSRLSYCSEFIAATFTSDVVLNHAVVDSRTGNIYVGGVNRLIQLDLNLSRSAVVTTGPVDDNPDCPPPPRTCEGQQHRMPTDNYNKILLLDELSNRLIFCGSALQGACEIRNVSNIRNVIHHGGEAVAANNATASTVAFLAPGPPGIFRERVMVVGTTVATREADGKVETNGQYRHLIPAVSSRFLDGDDGGDVFATHDDITTSKTFVEMSDDSLIQYPITYVHGFTANSFSYLLAITPDAKPGPTSVDSHRGSKIYRVCESDPGYKSFSEASLRCGEYNILRAASVVKIRGHLVIDLGVANDSYVIFAVFSWNHTTSSALCVYSLAGIEQVFRNNVEQCLMGSADSQPIAWINAHVSQYCEENSQLSVESQLCDPLSPYLNGSLAVSTMPVINYTDTLLTSVAVTTVEGNTVVFIGTEDGLVKKVAVDSLNESNESVEFGEVQVDPGSPVHADMTFDLDKKHLYVMTQRKLTKIRTNVCDDASSCEQCLDSHNPYCGWCPSTNRCSSHLECSSTWIHYRGGKCSKITQVVPSQLQVTTVKVLTITIEAFVAPVVNDTQFLCVFTLYGTSLSTPANRTGSGVQCNSPPAGRLTHILGETNTETHWMALLSVRQPGSPDVVSTNFTFFQCYNFKSCTACTGNEFGCSWCITSSLCTHSIERCKTDPYVIYGKESDERGLYVGVEHCPRIAPSGMDDWLVASGELLAVTALAENMGVLSGLFDPETLKCQFYLGHDNTLRVNATYNQTSETTGLIHCEPTMFRHSRNLKEVRAEFVVLWNGGKQLDNPGNITVIVYKCNAMQEQCGLCLLENVKYGCGWCMASEQCEIERQCPPGQWLRNGNSTVCPNPVIREFSPLTGPRQGGTNVTISGNNLGIHFQDIADGVTVAGRPCLAFESLYMPTRRIVCQTNVSGNELINEGPVVVTVTKHISYQAKSQDLFQYVDPVLTNVEPLIGPKSGGTIITVTGNHLNAGSSASVTITGNPTNAVLSKSAPLVLPCILKARNVTNLQCVTSAAPDAVIGTVAVSVDHARIAYQSEQFEYKNDPNVTRVSPPVGTGKAPGGIPSGGVMLLVEGEGFDAIQQPIIYVLLDNIQYHGPCQVNGSHLMVCLSPTIPASAVPSFRLYDGGVELEYGFIMDGVQSVQNISMKQEELEKFVLYPEPIVYEFEATEDGRIKQYNSGPGELLAIKIENYCEVCNRKEFFEVRIGTEQCDIVEVARKLLNCIPPAEQPSPGPYHKPDAEEAKDLPEVVVIMGNTSHHVIGYLQYDGGATVLPWWAYIIIGSVLFLLIIAVLVVVVKYHRKKSESDRILKDMQREMDELEAKVADQCRDAFAELQTAMTILTNSDTGGGGIPFYEYKYYVLKALFPGDDDYPILHELVTPGFDHPTVLKALKQFEQLINNKVFLLLYVRTLESNRYFSMKDRVNVASYLMVALQRHMDYCTDILKTLLAELIERSLQNPSDNPKVLLRRTESVAEKMLAAWFTFLLHRLLKEKVGTLLYKLCMAVEQQIDMGPVDAITNECKYALSLDKLIRQKIQYSQLAVHVYGPGHSSLDTKPILVKVLDCDTVTQAKLKALNAVYRNTPRSLRPALDEVDLVWRAGYQGKLILQDVDTITESDGEWKRLNTLNDYKISDGASFYLVPKQSALLNNSQDHSIFTYAENHALQMCTPPQSPITNKPSLSDMQSAVERGVKYWHLIKPADSDTPAEKTPTQRLNKLVSEIYLNRLLYTKGALQQFVDDLIDAIFDPGEGENAAVLPIKYMFDFLDDQALQHEIVDPDVVYTWKNNSLPLRFWVNLIKNPDFVFDVGKSQTVDACLSVIAQTFMDSCSITEHKLGKDSSTSKLLYAKDIPKYKQLVTRYYNELKQQPGVSDQDMTAMLSRESQEHKNDFNSDVALFMLYGYAAKYNEQILFTLQEDEFAKKHKLAAKLAHVFDTMAAAEHRGNHRGSSYC